MNPIHKALMVAATCISIASVAAAPMQQAEITRAFNTVKVITPAESHPAVVGEIIRGSTGLRTGGKSRAELKFSDGTLTRLGANSQFSFESGTRNLSLETGVLFLQVPKGAGGATIKTAAVTAAITGTTIMVEYSPDKLIKIIVIEGTLDLYFPAHPSTFITLKAGQMIMMQPDALGFPRPVEIDIQKLLATSDLANGNFAPLRAEALNAIAGTVTRQAGELKSGVLIGTNLVLPGRGNSVVLLTSDAALAIRTSTPLPPTAGASIPPPSSGGGGLPPVDPRYLPPPLLAGLWRVNDTLQINPTLPQITQSTSTGSGSIYLSGSSGPFYPWMFGTADIAASDELATFLSNSGEWASYLVTSLSIEGTPTVDTGLPRSVLFASPNTISSVSAGNSGLVITWALDGVDNWALFTQGGGIDFSSGGFEITGITSNLALYANGAGANVDIAGRIALGSGNLSTFSGGSTSVVANGDISLGQWTANGGSINLNQANVQASGNVTLTGDSGAAAIESVVQTNSTSLVGARITLQDSSQLDQLIATAGSGGRAVINTTGGRVKTGGGVLLEGATVVQATGTNSRVDIVSAVDGITIQGTDAATRVDISAADTIRIEAMGGQPAKVSMVLGKLAANNIIMQANGANALLDIRDSEILAGQSARLYAEGPGSILQFGGYVRLAGETVRLAGDTVNVLQNGFVDASGVSNLGIHANNHEYYLNQAGGKQPWGIISTSTGTAIYQTDYNGRNQPLSGGGIP